jgi:IclR family pca regulon transcriptional regulator
MPQTGNGFSGSFGLEEEHAGTLGRIYARDGRIVKVDYRNSVRISTASCILPGESAQEMKNMPRSASVSVTAECQAAGVPAAVSEGTAEVPSASLASFRGDPNFMTSLARGLTVIQAFTQKKRQLTISQLSTRTGLSRAAVRRCLYTLAKLGFAGSDDGRHFYLGPRILALGYSYIASMPLATAAQPVLERVSHELHESCSISTLDRSDIIYVARANVTRIMSIDLGVGSRLPAFCTSMGRILLAALPAEVLETYLTQTELKRFTERTITSVEKLRQVLRLVSRNGYSIVDQELELGLRSMAVPIQNPTGKIVASLNVGAHAQRVSIQEMQTKFLPRLRAAAQDLSMLLR